MSLLLALDIGNSSTKLGIFDGEALTKRVRAETAACTTTHGEVARWLDDQAIPWTHLDAVVLCSVVPAATIAWLRELDTRGHPPFVITGATPTAITNSYRNPAQLGADRLVTALAAWWLYGKPVATIAINLGTATTVDAVSSAGVFLGGAIVPGVGISLGALAESAVQLPPTEPERADVVLARDTESAICAGAYFGAIGQVKELLARATDELGEPAAIVVTGGFAKLIAPELPEVKAVDPDLTLKGVRLAWEQSHAHR